MPHHTTPHAHTTTTKTYTQETTTTTTTHGDRDRERDRERRKRKCGEDERQEKMKREEKRREKMKDEKRLFLFLRMFRILPFFFFNYFHDPNSIFRVEGIISAGVSGGTVSLRTKKLDDRVVSRDRSLREI